MQDGRLRSSRVSHDGRHNPSRRSEDGRPRLSSNPLLSLLARSLSIAGNPLVLIPLAVAATTRNARWTIAVALTTTLPLLVVITRKVRRGDWTDFDVSRRDQRLGLYAFGTPLFFLAAGTLYFLGASPRMMQAVAAGGVIFLAGLLGNRFLKLSMHMMFGAYAGILIAWVYPWSLTAIVIFIAALAWSRRFLGRHSWLEIALGTIIGSGAGLLAVF
jgi:hypothetical protein